MLVHAVSEDFHKLLQDGRLTSIAFLGELGGVVVVAIDTPLMLIIRVLGTKDRRADGAREMLNVVLAIQSCYVGASQRTAACKAEKIEPSEVVGFAERILIRRLVRYGKELGGHNLPTVLEDVSRKYQVYTNHGIAYMAREALPVTLLVPTRARLGCAVQYEQMVCVSQSSHKLARQMALALATHTLLTGSPSIRLGPILAAGLAEGILRRSRALL